MFNVITLINLPVNRFSMNTNDNFHDIYIDNLHIHYNAPEYTNSPRGFIQREKLGTFFQLTNPVERVCYT